MAEYCHNLFRPNCRTWFDILRQSVSCLFCRSFGALGSSHFSRRDKAICSAVNCSPGYMVDSSFDEGPVLVYLSLGIDTWIGILYSFFSLFVHFICEPLLSALVHVGVSVYKWTKRGLPWARHYAELCRIASHLQLEYVMCEPACVQWIRVCAQRRWICATCFTVLPRRICDSVLVWKAVRLKSISYFNRSYWADRYM